MPENQSESLNADDAANFLGNLSKGEFASDEDLTKREIASFCKTAAEIRKLVLDKGLMQAAPSDLGAFGIFLDVGYQDENVFNLMIDAKIRPRIPGEKITLNTENHRITIINLSFEKEDDTGEPYYQLSFQGLKNADDNDPPPLFYNYDFGLNHKFKKTIERHYWDEKDEDHYEAETFNAATILEVELISAGLHIVKSRIANYGLENE